MSGEQTAAEAREAELAKVFKRMGRAARRGDLARYEELKAEHDRLKREHMEEAEREQREAARARRAAQRASEVRVEPEVWRLPRGFSSPLAQQRARMGVRPREEPRGPEGGLRPWLGVHPASERVWRPPS